MFVLISGLVILFVWSCNHRGNTGFIQDAENRILQQEDGTVSLALDQAACYSDVVDPSINTAEWYVVISKPGRYKVWLSSATKDTMDLSYANPVRISLSDKQLEVDPACDNIIENSGDVPRSYFRADSYMGSIYIAEPGEYNLQVISEKVIAKNIRSQNTLLSDDTMLMSVQLTPLTR